MFLLHGLTIDQIGRSLGLRSQAKSLPPTLLNSGS